MNPSQQLLPNQGRHDDDSAITEFIASLMDYTPTIPDDLVDHYLSKSGFHCPDVRLMRLVAVATQKFVADVATDTLQQGRPKYGAFQLLAPGPKWPRNLIGRPCSSDKRLILTMDDLLKTLRENGVNVKHQEYFADSPSAGLDPVTREE